MESQFDLSLMKKSEVSKNLFNQIKWEEILRSGIFLTHQDHQLLERAQSNLGVIIDNKQDSATLTKMLITIAENCTSNLTVQQYVFTRIEEILGLANDSGDVDNEVFGTQHAKLFTSDGIHIKDKAFMNALTSPDAYLQQSAALSFACLLTICEGNIQNLINWINTKLHLSSSLSLSSLSMLCRKPSARQLFIQSNGINHIVDYLLKLGTNGNAQTIYELAFILWTLSMNLALMDTLQFNNKDILTVEPSPLTADPITSFLSAGTIQCLVDLVSGAPSRKVVRMCLGTLKNLAMTEDDVLLTEMLSGSLLKLLDNIVQTNTHKQANDPEFENDVKVLYEIMNRNYRDLSTFDRWVSQVHSGALRWGIVHTEKFWKENAKFAEENDFKIIKDLIALLKSATAAVAAKAGEGEETVVCIALYDLGEFTRFYPNGRGIVNTLGGKDLALELISSRNATIQSHALRCISKIMVSNWEFLR